MDAFAEFGLPRSPAVDEAALGSRFDELSRQHHPDAGGISSDFARIVEARRLLASPALRLRHLLDLAHPGTALAGALPQSLMDLFTILGPALQAAQEFVRRKDVATSALTRALLAPEEMRLRESLESAASTIAERLDTVVAASRAWSGDADSLAAWAREAAFLEKWQAQVRENISRLSLSQ